MIGTKRLSWFATAVLFIGLGGDSNAIGDSVPHLFQESYRAEAAGDLAGAVASLRRVPIGRRENYVYQLRLGWLLYLEGQHEASAVAYRRAVVLEPNAVEPRLGLLLPLMAQRIWADAEKMALGALAIDTHSYLASSRLAFILFSQGRYSEATECYRGVLALYPSDVEMRAGLAWSLAREGSLTEAEGEFERILAVAPIHPSAREGVEFVRSAMAQKP